MIVSAQTHERPRYKTILTPESFFLLISSLLSLPPLAATSFTSCTLPSLTTLYKCEERNKHP